MYRQKNPVGTVARWAMEGLNAIAETNDTWYDKRIKEIGIHPKLFKNWTVHERIYYHNEDHLLNSLEIDDSD